MGNNGSGVLRSLPLFPSGNGKYESGYLRLGESLGRNRLILPGEFFSRFLNGRVAYSDDQKKGFADIIPVLELSVRRLSGYAPFVVVPGPPLLWEPVQILDEYDELILVDPKRNGDRSLIRYPNNRAGFGWMLFRVPAESYGCSATDQTSLLRGDFEGVANLGQALWFFGLWKRYRGRYPLNEGKRLRVRVSYSVPWGRVPKSKRRTVKYVPSLPLFPDEVVEKTMLIGVEKGMVRLEEDDGGCVENVGLLCFEQVIQKI